MISMLVTGAAGFIGSHFTRYWLAEHPNDVIVALDALTYAGTETNLADIRQRITFVHGDIGDSALVQRVLSELEIDVVVNFAAESHNSLAVLNLDGSSAPTCWARKRYSRSVGGPG
jgi:dTDP-glucose 4,6-dehydratase